MKIMLIILFVLSSLLGMAGCSGKEDANDAGSLNNNEMKEEEVEVEQDQDYKTLSEELALQMVNGDFKDTHNRCSFLVKAQLSEKALKEGWDNTVAGMGDYIEVYQITQEPVDKYQSVVVILRYENNGLKISFTYNDSAKLEGIWLTYSPIEEEAVTTDSYEEIKIIFGEGEYPVTGILTLPKNVSNPPIAILVPGSGNHEVNEVVGANKPFQDIAWGLAKQGIASIRYNERAFLYPELIASGFSIEIDSLNDAADAIGYASSCEEIDKDRIYIVGHSLGGMMAPKIASDHKEINGIILLAGSPRKLEDIVYDQVIDAVENTEGVTEAQAEEALATTEEGIETIQKLTEGSDEVILGYPSSYWYSLNQIDIPKLAAELTIPMFITQGAEDWQVYADKDYALWQELVGDKKNVTFKLYENLNHLFMTSNGKRDITEYNTKDNVDQTVIDDMVRWIKDN